MIGVGSDGLIVTVTFAGFACPFVVSLALALGTDGGRLLLEEEGVVVGETSRVDVGPASGTNGGTDA